MRFLSLKEILTLSRTVHSQAAVALSNSVITSEAEAFSVILVHHSQSFPVLLSPAAHPVLEADSFARQAVLLPLLQTVSSSVALQRQTVVGCVHILDLLAQSLLLILYLVMRIGLEVAFIITVFMLQVILQFQIFSSQRILQTLELMLLLVEEDLVISEMFLIRQCILSAFLPETLHPVNIPEIFPFGLIQLMLQISNIVLPQLPQIPS